MRLRRRCASRNRPVAGPRGSAGSRWARRRRRGRRFGCRVRTRHGDPRSAFNYASAKELASRPRTNLWYFSRSRHPASVIGGVTRRPSGVKFMHYECELAVSSGARQAGCGSQALAHVAGYCLANDYAVRELLGELVSPQSARQESRGATVWVPGSWTRPMSLMPGTRLANIVNGNLTQTGNTATSDCPRFPL